jgi:hypothetical protein
VRDWSAESLLFFSAGDDEIVYRSRWPVPADVQHRYVSGMASNGTDFVVGNHFDRIWILSIDDSLGTPCDAAEECASGFCRDGVCCDSPCESAVGQCPLACSVAAGAPEDGVCRWAEGAPCDDGAVCTLVDTCTDGTCAGTPVLCAPLTCHAPGACDASSGTCTYALLDDGAACDDDDACTIDDICTAGACAGTPLACEDRACHAPSSCDATLGTCADSPLANGTVCDDGDACTLVDICTDGTCAGSPVVCGPFTCFTPGVCDASTGTCTYAPLDDGAPCVVMGVCGGSGVCQQATCTMTAPVCDDQNPCTQDTCDEGDCTHTILPDGMPCRNRSCVDGKCVGDGLDGGSARVDAGAEPVTPSGCTCDASTPEGAPLAAGVLFALLIKCRRRATAADECGRFARFDTRVCHRAGHRRRA